MSETQRSLETSKPADGPPPSLPWWLTRRARLPALLACLAVAGAGLAQSRTGLFAHGGSASANTRGCPPATPALSTVGLDQLVALRASILPVVAPINRRRYAAGTVSPEVAWTDNSPQKLRSSRSRDDRWPASYEMRVWAANGDDVVADVFQFAGNREARVFFAEASNPHCHLAAAGTPASRPPQGRNLIWTNPDGPTQQDLFLLRGPRVYRIADVRGRHRLPASAERRIGVWSINALACLLPDAGCLVRGTSA